LRLHLIPVISPRLSHLRLHPPHRCLLLLRWMMWIHQEADLSILAVTHRQKNFEDALSKTRQQSG
jgi:hypothetical protein